MTYREKWKTSLGNAMPGLMPPLETATAAILASLKMFRTLYQLYTSLFGSYFYLSSHRRSCSLLSPSSRQVSPMVKVPPSWDLIIMLMGLMGPPFEPMAFCSLYHLSVKTTFFVAVTSSSRRKMIQAFIAGTLYTVFYKDKVTLRPHPKFLLKVVTEFHLNLVIHLLVFFPKPYTTQGE